MLIGVLMKLYREGEFLGASNYLSNIIIEKPSRQDPRVLQALVAWAHYRELEGEILHASNKVSLLQTGAGLVPGFPE